ncbi:competence protein [Anaerobacillus alkalidiazotrophicus]|uniref:Competence protein n=1 Tax=Anaerobacillus alkalidiazotrophicus TaxID=472963 RepID=A0A1S2MAB2_9BACI|nr:competence protein ComK [Anaerobacillus alkalidiazotrophicus]OIJ21712.1 competence protein [Anaerobacillus alkalidiazotrophicus]
MTNPILKTYEITKNTMALLPIAHTDYHSIAIEPTCQFYIRKTPLQLIKSACLEGGSTYEGRRAAVIHQTGAKHKVPIPINPLEQIYAFPSHSPSQFECSWIFHHHIRSLTPQVTPKKMNETVITFKNNQQLKLPVSYYTMEKQLQRTSYCMIRFSHRLFELSATTPTISTELSY